MSRSSAAARVSEQAALFAALGDETRLDLVNQLSSGPQSIARLASGATVTRQAITKHLEVLSGAGLVRDEWRGRERVFELDPRRVDDARRWLEQIAERWDARLAKLRKLVEED